jgi:hypothetical protein
MSGQHKYIVAQVEGEPRIFVFPTAIDHDRMWQALECIRFGSDRDWKRSLRQEGSLISAGFVTDDYCHGHSETLGVECRGMADTLLLKGTQ